MGWRAPGNYAREFYAALREADLQCLKTVRVMRPSEKGVSIANRDDSTRSAATGQFTPLFRTVPHLSFINATESVSIALRASAIGKHFCRHCQRDGVYRHPVAGSGIDGFCGHHRRRGCGGRRAGHPDVTPGGAPD